MTTSDGPNLERAFLLANDINAADQVVGWNNIGAILWTAGSGMVPLSTSQDHSDFRNARAINNNGEVVGDGGPDFENQYAARWDPVNGVVDLNTRLVDNPYGAYLTYAVDINDQGQVVCVCDSVGGPGYVPTPVGTPPAPNSMPSKIQLATRSKQLAQWAVSAKRRLALNPPRSNSLPSRRPSSAARLKIRPR